MVPKRLSNFNFRTTPGFGLGCMFRLRVVAAMVKVRVSIQGIYVCLLVFACLHILHVITVAPESWLNQKSRKEISLP